MVPRDQLQHSSGLRVEMASLDEQDRDERNRIFRIVLVLSHTNITTQLDESPEQVSKSWNKTVRPAIFAELEGAGQDWIAAANFPSNIPGEAPYVAAQVLATDNTGVPTLTLPNMRQRAMLALLKRFFPRMVIP